jgi:hypothetical protein
MVNSTGLVSDDVVLKARRLVREDPSLTHRQLASQFNVNASSLEKAIRGQTYKHLNDTEAPVLRSIKKDDKRQEARELYLQGMSYLEISKQISIPKSSLSLWLRDIVRPPKVAKPKTLSIVERSKDTTAAAKSEKVVKSQVGQPGEGPYTGYLVYKYAEKDDVTRVRLYSKNDQTVMSYGRYLMSVHLNRVISPEEVVRHKEGKEDTLDNLVLLKKTELKEFLAEKRKTSCVICNTQFIPRRTNVKTCSRACTKSHQLTQMAKARLEIVHTCVECQTEFSSSSNKPLVCSSTCANKRKTRIRNERKPPKEVKPPKPQLPKKKYVYTNECVICESKFVTSRKIREVCYQKECKDIIAESLAYEKAFGS